MTIAVDLGHKETKKQKQINLTLSKEEGKDKPFVPGKNQINLDSYPVGSKFAKKKIKLSMARK